MNQNGRMKILIATLLCLLIIGLCAAASAADSGTCGDNLTWTLDDNGLLTISGTGEMTSSPWEKSAVKTVSIENGVTSIGYRAFADCSNLTSVTIPDSVTSIEGYAFEDCSSLTSITIPNGVTGIVYNSFEFCNAIRYASLGSGAAKALSKIGYSFRLAGTQYDLIYRFSDGQETGLELTSADKEAVTVIIVDGVTRIGREAFNDCTSLTSVTIPDGVTSIGHEAFEGCTSLTSVNIPDSLTSIEYNAFYNCKSLMSITIPDRVTSIGSNAFYNCPAIRYASFGSEAAKALGKRSYAFRPAGTQYDLKYLFSDDQETGLEFTAADKEAVTVIIPDSVTRVGYEAFRDCTSLTSVTIPDGVTSIGSDAFYNCPAIRYASLGSEAAKALSKQGYTFHPAGAQYDLKYLFDSDQETGLQLRSVDPDAVEVTIPAEVTAIYSSSWGDDTGAFNDCASLTSVTLNSAVTDIRFAEIFSECVKLEAINFPAGHAAYCSKDGVILSKDETQIIYCPKGKPGEYTIPGTVPSIDKNVFTGCTALTGITIPTTVSSVSDYAFKDCSGLQKATVEARSENIPFTSMFDGCTSLVSVTIPADHHTYSSKGGVVFNKDGNALLFYPKGKNGSYTIPEGVTYIGGGAFASCKGLTGVRIPEGVISIGWSAFWECTGLTEIAFPGSLEGIDGHAFQGCTSLGDIVLAKVQYISSCAFSGCTSMKSATFDYSTYGISTDAFDKSVLFKAPKDSTAAKWAYDHYYEIQYIDPVRTITLYDDGHGTASASPASGAEGTEVTLTAKSKDGYKFKEWVVISGGVTIEKDRFTIGKSEIEIRATFEELAVGDSFVSGGMKYKILTEKTVSFLGLKKAKSKTGVDIPATVKCGKKTYKVTEIADKAMYKDTKVTTVTIGKNVKTIGQSAFSGAKALATVKGGKGVNVIGDSAFASCAKLKTFPALSNLKTIGAGALKGCKALTKITIGASVEMIGKNAFNGCANLKSFTVKSKKLTADSIGAGAFKNISKKAAFKCPSKKLAKSYETIFKKAGAPKTAKFSQ